MSALIVGGAAAGTVVAAIGAFAVVFMKDGFKDSFDPTTPDGKVRAQREFLTSLAVLGGVSVLAGAGGLTLKSHNSVAGDIGMGIALGVGGIAALIAFDHFFPKATFPAATNP